MPPKKRAKPNGFSCFASEIMKNSRDNLTFCQALSRANPIWKQMNENERKSYHLMAKTQEPRDIKKCEHEKKNSEGIKLSVVKAKVIEKEEKIRDMKRSIQQIVKQSKNDNKFETKKHYFIAVNYFVCTGGIYVPAEISIAEFSLQDGVTRKYSTYINPAVDIFGHTFDAKEHALKTHRLPIPPKAMGEKNLSVINKHIMEFIKNDDDSTDSIMPVYTHKDSMEIVKSALKFLNVDNANKNFELPVYSINYLLFIMKEIACEIGELPIINSPVESDAYFERDEFEYQIGISCDYHENLDCSKYCTQAIVTRWGFMFAKYMCNDIAIAMRPGRHFPKKVPVIASISKECKFEKMYKSRK